MAHEQCRIPCDIASGQTRKIQTGSSGPPACWNATAHAAVDPGMSDIDTGEKDADLARRDATARQWNALLDIADQQIALEDYTPEPPPRVTLRVVGGDDVEIPCSGDGPCEWRHDGPRKAKCERCDAWATLGMVTYDKILASIGPAK